MRLQNLMIEANVLIIPTEPKSKWRKVFFKLVENKQFDTGVIILIILNMVALCMEISTAGPTYKKMLEIFNIFFVIVFAIEATLKLIGLGPTFYFKNS
jgi:hypothetical protein